MSMEILTEEIKEVASENYDFENRQHKNDTCNFSLYRPTRFLLTENTRGVFSLRLTHKLKTVH